MDNRKNIEYVSQGKATKFPLYILKENNQQDTDLHSHEFVELVLILHGTAVHRVKDHEVQIQRGDLFLVPRGVCHSYINGSNLELVNVLYIPEMIPMVQLDAVNLQAFDTFYKGIPSDRELYPFMRLPEEDFRDLERIVLDLHEENFYRHNGFQFIMLGLFMTLLCRIMRFYKQEPDSGKNTGDIGKVIAFIHSNFRKKITLEQLCRSVGMSRSALMRLFTHTVGVAPIQYQQQLRISEAMQLLQMTGKSLGEIAFELGFSDSNYFGRQFKKITGFSPNEYRKKLWKNIR